MCDEVVTLIPAARMTWDGLKALEEQELGALPGGVLDSSQA